MRRCCAARPRPACRWEPDQAAGDLLHHVPGREGPSARVRHSAHAASLRAPPGAEARKRLVFWPCLRWRRCGSTPLARTVVRFAILMGEDRPRSKRKGLHGSGADAGQRSRRCDARSADQDDRRREAISHQKKVRETDARRARAKLASATPPCSCAGAILPIAFPWRRREFRRCGAPTGRDHNENDDFAGRAAGACDHAAAAAPGGDAQGSHLLRREDHLFAAVRALHREGQRRRQGHDPDQLHRRPEGDAAVRGRQRAARRRGRHRQRHRRVLHQRDAGGRRLEADRAADVGAAQERRLRLHGQALRREDECVFLARLSTTTRSISI